MKRQRSNEDDNEYDNDNLIIHFNVSGIRKDIARSTIMRYPESFLAKLIIKESNDEYFIDQNADVFDRVIEVYRGNGISGNDRISIEEVYKLLDVYEIKYDIHNTIGCKWRQKGIEKLMSDIHDLFYTLFNSSVFQKYIEDNISAKIVFFDHFEKKDIIDDYDIKEKYGKDMNDILQKYFDYKPSIRFTSTIAREMIVKILHDSFSIKGVWNQFKIPQKKEYLPNHIVYVNVKSDLPFTLDQKYQYDTEIPWQIILTVEL